MSKWIVFIVIIILSIAIIYFNTTTNKISLKVKSKLNNFFYNVDEVNTDLRKIDNYKYKILDETLKIYNDGWTDWPEKELYHKKGSWKIFPFYAFGTWVNKNCMKCPTIYKFLRKVKGLKMALLSKMSPDMKLKPHKGWASHSNYVVRCHYGLIVPDGCYISVSDLPLPEKGSEIDSIVLKNNEIKRYQNKFKWLIFDDSKTHYAENTSNEDRIVLILDVERPSNIEIGKSDVGDSKELIELVKYFRDNNIKIK